MKNKNYIGVICLTLLYASCKVPKLAQTPPADKIAPTSFPKDSLDSDGDTTNIANVNWNKYFKDPYLDSLIDSALVNNQELNMTLQEIEIARNEVSARSGAYLPFVDLGGGVAAGRSSKYSIDGATWDQTDIREGHTNPGVEQDYWFGAQANWEVDIWNKLHNATKAAAQRYLSTVEGKNFLVTNLIAEVANSYYELLALDNQLQLVEQNIKVQSNALEIVRYQKAAARTTELAVRKFEAEVLRTKSMQYNIQQQITVTENRINFLCGRYPQHIDRDDKTFDQLVPTSINSGVPAQLLDNRPDIRQAELALKAAKLDVQVAKARFYPSLNISADLGYDAFNPKYLFSTPKAILASMAGGLVGPLINKKAIKADYANANATQIEAVYNYQQTVLKAYNEVVNQLANMKNLKQSFDLQSAQVDKLSQSIETSLLLFKNARADYMEVLMTQRDYLTSKFELIDTQRSRLNALVNVYQALGGGWDHQLEAK